MANQKELTPKWFDSTLTGDSKANRGLLSGAIKLSNSHECGSNEKTSYNDIKKAVKRYLNKTHTTLGFTHIIDNIYYGLEHSLDNTHTIIQDTEKISIGFKVETLRCELEKGKESKVKIINLLYRVTFTIVTNDDEPLTIKNKNEIQNQNMVITENTYHPAEVCKDMLDRIIKSNLLDEPDTAKEIVNAFIDEYNIANNISESAKTMAESAHVALCNFIINNNKKIDNNDEIPGTGFKYGSELNHVLDELDYFEIPLEFYKTVHDCMAKYLNNNTAYYISKSSLNMKLNDYLYNLNKVKDQLPHVIGDSTIELDPKFSNEQLTSIKTESPLMITQAGAGTGKSTTILERINYMTACNIDPQSILVLSFTNAAADNITEKNPNVKSITIADMIKQVYEHNFKHVLSSPRTMINSLEILCGGKPNEIIRTFMTNLSAIDGYGNTNIAFKNLSEFVSNNIDAVISILDGIGQTCLEVQILLAYELIEKLAIPESVKATHVIVDEVQDNSIFEFIYLIKSATLFKQSLYIVGDCSQTLYEFRNANPKVLNILESSGVFDTNTLQTNYRSNQEILNFANQVLGDVEANKYANIRLQSNDTIPVTEQSFREKITLKCTKINTKKGILPAIEREISMNLDNYIKRCIGSGEQITILAPTRAQVRMIEDRLTFLYPELSIANIIPKRAFDATLFSEFIKQDWRIIKNVEPKTAPMIIESTIMSNIANYVKSDNAIAPSINTFRKWKYESTARVNNLVQAYASDMIDKDRFYTEMRNDMLNYEIRNNAIRQSFSSTENQRIKDEAVTADILLSTIHSSKGLEFDNVIVIHTESKNTEEADKRMYYVALTRAVKTELVWSFSTENEPVMVRNYNKEIESTKQI